MSEIVYPGEEGLAVGETGYVFDHGNYWPARVVCNDLVQTFGPIDAIVVYRKYEGHEFTTRFTDRSCSCSGLYWVDRKRFAEIERDRVKKELAKLNDRLSALTPLDTARDLARRYAQMLLYSWDENDHRLDGMRTELNDWLASRPTDAA